MSFLGEDNFSHEDKQKVGVIICNLGSPDSYSTKDVRKYLLGAYLMLTRE